MEKEKYLSDFIKMSKYAGMHNDYVQAGGGNTSVKLDEKYMAIKASGYQLTDMEKDNGYSIVNYTRIVEYFDESNCIPHNEAGSNEVLMKSLVQGQRPSIETFLHAITKKFTLHSHPTCVNVMVTRKDGMDILKKMIPEALYVDFAIPGIELADQYFETFKACEEKVKGKDVRIIFLKNHGVVVTADSAQEAMELHDYVIWTISNYLGIEDVHLRTADKIFQSLYDLTGDIVYCIRTTKELEILTQSYGGAQWNFAFAPDCLVYCGKKILDLNEADLKEEIQRKYEEYSLKYGTPKVAYKNGSYFAFAANLKKAQDIESVLQFCAKVCVYNDGYEVEWLTDRVQNQILNLDSEKYRQQIK